MRQGVKRVVCRIHGSASYDRFGRMSVEANGDPAGVGVNLNTLAQSDYVLNYGTAGNVQPLTGDNPLTDVSALCDFWPWPETPQNVRVVCQSLFGDGSVADLAACPSVDLVISRTLGAPGAEYTVQVTGFNVAVSYAHGGAGPHPERGLERQAPADGELPVVGRCRRAPSHQE